MCGRSACTVRREGRRKPSLPLSLSADFDPRYDLSCLGLKDTTDYVATAQDLLDQVNNAS